MATGNNQQQPTADPIAPRPPVKIPYQAVIETRRSPERPTLPQAG
jgi:hypothetical protein